MGRFRKDPNAIKDYGFDWAAPPAKGGPWLQAGDTIATSTWATTPDAAGLTKVTDTNTTTTTKIVVAGGTLGQTYTITNTIVTAGGLRDERSHQLVIENS